MFMKMLDKHGDRVCDVLPVHHGKPAYEGLPWCGTGTQTLTALKGAHQRA